MAHKYALAAEVRTVLGKKVKNLRQQGLLPATVYGKGFDPVSVQISDRDFAQVFRQAGRTTVIDLNINGKGTQAVFVHAVQRHPVSRAILHIDLKVVDLRKPMQLEVPIAAVGESLPVSRGDALLNMLRNTVPVEALPDNIPQHVEADVSILSGFDKHVTVADLPQSATYKVLLDAEEVLISLTQVRAAAEDEAAEAEGGAQAEADGDAADEDKSDAE